MRALGRSRAQQVVYGIGCVGLAVQMALVLARPGHFQWDFRAYFYAVQLWRGGGNPYDYAALADLQAATGSLDANYLPFLYPPHALLWFLPVGFTPFVVAYYLYAFLKIAAIVGFLVLAARWVCPGWWRALTPLFACLLFGGAIPADLRNGNVALFEAILLFAGFALLLRDRQLRFAALTTLAASWKVVLAPLTLATLFLSGPPRPWRRALATVAILPAVMVAGWLLAPELSRNFVTASELLANGWGPGGERGALNTSALRLLTDVSYLGFGGLRWWFIGPAFALVAAGVLVLSFRAWRRYLAGGDRVAIVALLVLTWGLLVPRLTPYSYALMVIPCLIALQSARPRWLTVVVPVVGCIPFALVRRKVFGADPLAPAESFLLLPLEYANYLVLLAFWLMLTVPAARADRRSTPREHASPDEAEGGYLRAV